MGVFFTIYYFGCAALPAMAGAMYNHSGSGRSALWMACALAAATVPALGLFRGVLTHGKPA